MSDLFHAYVVGGNRADARAAIADLLAPHGLYKKNSSDYVVYECVTFSIENARELRAWQELVPSEGTRKTHIVYADFITREAENALLKTLEEPVFGTYLIFALPNPGMLLPTLLSRVRVIESVEASGSTSDAKNFLALTAAERLAYVAKLVAKSDDDDAAAEVRTRALALLCELEQFFSTDSQKNCSKLELILKYKKYLQISGASSKMILETLVLTI